MTSAIDELELCLRRSPGAALPVLFIGSGFSRRYLNSPTWTELLDQYSKEAGRPFSYYRAKANDDLPTVASLIAEDFFEVWYNDGRYADSRTEYVDKVKSTSDPLKFEISKYLLSLRVLKSKLAKSELKSFKKAHIQAVLTTNWDGVIERKLPGFETFVGQSDILFTSLQSIGETYKIHGCATDPASLILTKEDYDVYWERNPYLIAKMITLFVEHPVIFIGYSVTDAHIQKLLANLARCLTDSQLEVLNDRLIFLRRLKTGEAASFAHGTLSVDDHSLRIRELATDDFGAVYEMLGRLPRKFPAKLVRQFKESVYQLAYDREGASKIKVTPFETQTDISEIDMVIGVGVMARLSDLGYGHYRRSDLMRDMLDGRRDLDPRQVAGRLLDEIFGAGSRYCPVYYPLCYAERLRKDGSAIESGKLHNSAAALLQDPSKIENQVSDQTRFRSLTFRDLLKEGGKRPINYGTACRYEVEDVVELRKYLIQTLGHETFVDDTGLAKLACKYDQLVFGIGFTGERDVLHRELGLNPEQWTLRD